MHSTKDLYSAAELALVNRHNELQNLQLTFWILAIPSLGYEKVCVLFNIAALQSAVAATQSIENDDSLKLAAKLLQVSYFSI